MGKGRVELATDVDSKNVDPANQIEPPPDPRMEWLFTFDGISPFVCQFRLIEQRKFAGSGAVNDRVRPRPHFSQPLFFRSGEANLVIAVEDWVRRDPSHRFAENMLANSAIVQQVSIGKAESEGNNFGCQKGNSTFDPVSHAVSIFKSQ